MFSESFKVSGDFYAEVDVFVSNFSHYVFMLKCRIFGKLGADIESSWNFACNLMLAGTMVSERFMASGDFYAEVDVLCQNFRNIPRRSK